MNCPTNAQPILDHIWRSRHDIAASRDDSESPDDSASDLWKGDCKFKADSVSCLGNGNAKSEDNSEGTLEMGDGERCRGMDDSEINDGSEIDCSPGKGKSDRSLGGDSKPDLGRGDGGRGLGSSGRGVGLSDPSKAEGSPGKGGSECSHGKGGGEYDCGMGDDERGLGYGGSNEESEYERDLGKGNGGSGLG